MTNRAAQLLISAALVAVVATPAFAQEAAGPARADSVELRGRVVDAVNGQPIAFAQVEIVGTNRRDITDDDGYYRIYSLETGVFDLRAVSVGYGAVVVPDVVFEISTRLEDLDFLLAPEECLLTALFNDCLRSLGYFDAAAIWNFPAPYRPSARNGSRLLEQAPTSTTWSVVFRP